MVQQMGPTISSNQIVTNFVFSVVTLIFNRPCVAGASRNCQSQTGRAMKLIFLENIHSPPCVTCQVSHVRCQVSGVACQTFFVDKEVTLVGGGSVINGAYTLSSKQTQAKPGAALLHHCHSLINSFFHSVILQLKYLYAQTASKSLC